MAMGGLQSVGFWFLEFYDCRMRAKQVSAMKSANWPSSRCKGEPNVLPGRLMVRQSVPLW